MLATQASSHLWMLAELSRAKRADKHNSTQPQALRNDYVHATHALEEVTDKRPQPSSSRWLSSVLCGKENWTSAAGPFGCRKLMVPKMDRRRQMGL